MRENSIGTAGHCALLSAIAATMLVLLSGCATATKPESMAVQEAEGASYNQIPEPVMVITGGGQETSSMGASQVSDDDFKTAIIESINQTGLFADAVVEKSAATYILRAEIIDVEQPAMGFSMSVTMEVAWSLSRPATDELVWRASHQSTYTAAVSEAFAGVTRLRIATEGAAKENISWALQSISELEEL